MIGTNTFKNALAQDLIEEGLAEEDDGYGYATGATGEDVAEHIVNTTWFQQMLGATQDALLARVVTFELDPALTDLLNFPPRRDLTESHLIDDVEDYFMAPSGEGPQAYTWSDKPHRLVYDLVAEVRRLSTLVGRRDAEIAEMREAARWNLDVRHPGLS